MPLHQHVGLGLCLKRPPGVTVFLVTAQPGFGPAAQAGLSRKTQGAVTGGKALPCHALPSRRSWFYPAESKWLRLCKREHVGRF